MLSVWRSWAYIVELSRKWLRELEISTGFSPHPNMNMTLPVINVQIDREWCSSLVDSGCSLIIVGAECCCKWTEACINVQTLRDKIQTEEGLSAFAVRMVILLKSMC